MSALREIRRSSTGLSLALVVLAVTLVAGCGDRKRDPRLQEGLELVRQNRVDEAIALVNAVLTDHPDDAAAYTVMGIALFRSGDLEGSLHQYRNALEIDPDYPEARFNLSNSLRLLEREDEAEKELVLALENPKKWETTEGLVAARYTLGARYLTTNRPELALKQFRQCVDADDQCLPAWFDIGRILYESGDFDGSIAPFTRYLELDPGRKEARVFLGNALLQSSAEDHLAKAEVEFRAAVGVDPEYVEGLYSLGMILALQGKMDAAEREFAHAYRLTADKPDGIYHLKIREWFTTYERPLPAIETGAPSVGSSDATSG